jgi:hypothetical protein
MRYLKKILLIILNDGTRYTYSVPEGKTYREVYQSILSTNEFIKEDVRDVLYFPHTFYDLEEYQYYYNEETKSIDEKSIAINFKIDEFRKQRGILLKSLDMEFMRALEDPDCVGCKEKVVQLKDHLRSLPNKLHGYLQEKTTEEITKFNCFNNIFHIHIINGGSGYTSAPEITISKPNIEGTYGMDMKAEALITNGVVTEVVVTQVGSNYLNAPSVSFSKPENGNVALAVASEPENDIL